MSERYKPHNGRDRSGHYRVRQADVEDLRTEPGGEELIKDDVRLGGAVEDVGAAGAERAKHIADLVQENDEAVDRLRDSD
jgi:hypothetical protein